MIRRLLPFFLIVAVLGGVSRSAYPQDRVERKDRKNDKAAILNGTILEESPAGIKLKLGTKDELIPPTEILRVMYNNVPAVAKLSFTTLFLNEEKEKDLTKTLKTFKELVPQIAAGDPNAKRYVQYRIAQLTAQLAQSDPDKDDARRLLQEFVSANSNSWEFTLAARQLARMQIEKGELETAQKTLESLVKTMGVPPEIKTESDNLLTDVLFQSGELDKVKTRIAAARAVPTITENEKARLSVYEIGCDAQGEFKIEDVVKKLDDTIAKTNDNSVKALAYNIMGDCYMRKANKRQAMWAWLWVDVVYNQDPGEHLKAMTRLLKYYADEADPEKKQLYEDKIKRSK